MSIRQILTLANVASATTSGTTAVSGDGALLQDLVAELVATEDVASTSLDVKIQDRTAGDNWHDWIVFTQFTTTGLEAKAPTRPPLGDLRVVYTIPDGTWTFTVKLSANPLR